MNFPCDLVCDGSLDAFVDELSLEFVIRRFILNERAWMWWILAYATPRDDSVFDLKGPMELVGWRLRNPCHDREIAILVTDSGNPKKLFPVRWGNACATGHVRIRVNAEGADAYVVSFKEKPKGALARCIAASDKSQFKFDYNCDMRLEDMQKLKVLQVIRKRVATYEKPIPISLVAFDKETANSGQSCAD